MLKSFVGQNGKILGVTSFQLKINYNVTVYITSECPVSHSKTELK